MSVLLCYAIFSWLGNMARDCESFKSHSYSCSGWSTAIWSLRTLFWSKLARPASRSANQISMKIANIVMITNLPHCVLRWSTLEHRATKVQARVWQQTMYRPDITALLRSLRSARLNFRVLETNYKSFYSKPKNNFMDIGDSWRRVHCGRRHVESWVHLSCSCNHTWYLSFFLHRQNFWRIKFTPKNANFSR